MSDKYICIVMEVKEKAIEALRAQAVRENPKPPGKWISLSSGKYPEDGERILLWDTMNKRAVTGYYSCPHWEAEDARVEASHWMPLPEPPKEAL